MKKWLDEEYEFEVEVIGFCVAIIQSITVGMVKKSEINIPAPMDVLSMQRDMVSFVKGFIHKWVIIMLTQYIGHDTPVTEVQDCA